MDILNNVITVAKEKKFHINRLEQEAGISRAAIYKWKDHSPNVATLKKVADILGVTVDRLLQ